MCEWCNRLTAVCDADVHGCGSTPARDDVIIGDGSGMALPPFDGTMERTFDPTAKDETWRDRPPLL